MKRSQTDMLLELLRSRGSSGVTPLEALEQTGSLRLAARVADLRAAGFRIDTDMVKRGDKTVARYVLVERPVQLRLEVA